MVKARKRPDLPTPTCKEALEILKRVDDSTVEFSGQLDELENALGMFMLGRLMGWKVIVLIHNKRTIRKYEAILGINIREAFPEEGPLAHKSVGLNIAKKLGNFWKAVSGEIKIEDRRELTQA